MITGIYKITSPRKRVYIGQSIEIEKRFDSYKKLNCKSQTKLYRSFLKHGVENHIFKIVIECEIEQLNELERYYQDLYSVLGKNGLNCMLTRTDCRSGELSEKTRLKMSYVGKLRTYSAETRAKMAASAKGKIISKETRAKISETLKGRIISPKHRAKLSAAGKLKTLSNEHRSKISDSQKKRWEKIKNHE